MDKYWWNCIARVSCTFDSASWHNVSEYFDDCLLPTLSDIDYDIFYSIKERLMSIYIYTEQFKAVFGRTKMLK